ncbi:MAG TPA: septum site-determining protein MinC [Chloroflexi bacterium]|nr:septum site-determining protein MinC [Chloroflexota bacterium]
MSESPLSQETTHPAPTNGLPAYHARIADLLDDVTTSVEVATAATPPVENAAPVSTGVVSLFTPLPEHQPDVASPPPAPEPGAPLPGERLVNTPRRPVVPASTRNLPPFLAPPAASSPSAPVASPMPASPSPVEEPTSVSSADASGAEPIAANQLVNIKGRSDGIAVEVGRGSWPEILGVLTKRLEQSAGFFRDGSVALDVGARPVVEDELRQFATVLTQFEMKLGVVRTSSERTFQAALATGMTATLESPEGAPVATAAPAATNTDAASYFVYRGYLRSGHRLRRKENVLVIGDINPGAEVFSEGDILVWGRLRGVVHAGVGGNRRAIVAALDLEPTQLRIADVTTIGPDPKPGQPGRFFWKKSQHKRPEIARLVQNEIVLEEWDAARPGGLVSLRRGAG